VLGALDDKIEVNRTTARVLEGIARAVFTSWFVDFDPVRSNIRRREHAVLGRAGRFISTGDDITIRDPGGKVIHRAGDAVYGPIAHLFPDRLVDSAIGEVPEGWRVGTIDSLCDSISSGGTPARMNKEYWEGGTIPWFKTGELFDAPLFDSEEHITEAALANSSCKLWPARTVLFALYASPTVGRMGVLTRPGTSNQAAAGLIVKPEYGVPFLLNALFFARAKLQQIAVGAAQQNINQGVLKAHQIVVPSAGLALKFSQMMTPALEKQAQLSSQSATLAALRDALLPKLISGELRIADAEKIVGRAV
jgi:type I restriction enzyme S subunit